MNENDFAMLDTSGLSELEPTADAKDNTENTTLNSDNYSLNDISHEADETALPTVEFLDGGTESTAMAELEKMKLSNQPEQFVQPVQPNTVNNAYNPPSQNNQYQQQPYNYGYTKPKTDLFETDEYIQEGIMITEGEKITKILAITLMVISAVDLVGMLIGGRFTGIFGAGLRIFASYMFMKGSHKWRIFLGVVTAISTVAYLFVTIFMNGFTKFFMSSSDLALTASTLVGVLQFIFLLISAAFGVMTYMIFCNKKIIAYCDRNS